MVSALKPQLRAQVAQLSAEQILQLAGALEERVSYVLHGPVVPAEADPVAELAEDQAAEQAG